MAGVNKPDRNGALNEARMRATVDGGSAINSSTGAAFQKIKQLF